MIAHYGSAAGELAACVQRAGLVDRSDLLAVELTGDADSLAELTERVSGWAPAPGGCSFAAGVWWCARSRRCVVALAEPDSRAVVDAASASGPPGIRATDLSARLTAIGVVGKATLKLLAAVGAMDDPRAAPCFGTADVGGAEVEVLLQSDRRAVILAPRESAAAVWSALETAGRPLGVCYAGAEALARFTLMERMLERASALPRS